MRFKVLRFASVAALAIVVALSTPVSAQNNEQRPDQRPQSGGEPGKDSPSKRVDEFAEAAKILGGPASNPECVWLGRRVVNLLWRDDLETAFRHLDLYDRFGCPGGHVQESFRCVVRQGNIDPKAPESLTMRVHACWINPALQPSGSGSP